MKEKTKYKLPDGLRVITIPADSQVVYCGIVVHAGTRHETPSQYGLAHFCEHLMFKGTARRSSRKIINDIEGLGGELNAFTNKEDTVYYCAIQQEHLPKAVDVLCDMVFNSTFPQAEVEKEREVVCDEIESYEDSPAELIYDEFENILFDGHSLGHNILGTSDQVRSYNSADAKRFTQQWYKPENSVLFVSGGMIDPSGKRKEERARLCRFLALRGCSGASRRSLQRTPNQAPSAVANSCVPSVASDQRSSASLFTLHSSLPKDSSLYIRERGTHQAHVIMGTRAYAADDPRRWALYLLNNILGGPAMNSLLSLSLRERHGLVYTVESTMVSYSDAGMWSVYFGCDEHDVQRCCRLVRRELDKLMLHPLTDARLRLAKRQLQGQLAIASDNREQYAIDYARTFLHTGKCRTLADVMRHIDSLTADDLLSVAQQLFAKDNITTLIYK